MLFDIIDLILSLITLRSLREKRGVNVRRVLAKEGLKLTRKEYSSLCVTGNLVVNEKMIMPDDRLRTGVHIIRVYAGGRGVSFWVEVYRNKVRAYTM